MSEEAQPLEPQGDLIYIASGGGALRQGEILSELRLWHLLLDRVEAGDETQFVERGHPLAIVVTQDCDLEQDFKIRGQATDAGSPTLIPSILLCEVFTAQELRGRRIDASVWKRLKQNKDERYHFLEAIPPEHDGRGVGLPELGIDFKRYFTVPANELYLRLKMGHVQRRARLASPYLEHLSTRFAYFQFRVALPRDHHSVPEE